MREDKNVQSRSKSGRKLYLCIEELRKIDQLLTVNTAATFLVVALSSDHRSGLNMREIEKRLGMPSSTTSRNVQALSMRHADGTGHNLLETVPDPKDPRAKLVFLSVKGNRLWQIINTLMGV